MTEQARILIVDDEPTVQKLLVLTFKSRPWHVEACGSAEEGLERCRAQPYDLLVLDKNLPAMSGPDMLKTLREEGDTASCILMTAYASAESAVEMMALGVDAYLEKPFNNLDEVGQRVEDILRQRHDSQRRTKNLAAARDHFRRAKQALEGDEIEVEVADAQPRTSSGLSVVVACPSQADRDFFGEQLADDLRFLQFVLSSSELTEEVRDGAADLLIVDAVLAGGSLTDFVKQLRKVAPAPGLILISDRLPLKVVTALIDEGVDALVERPFDVSSFRRNTEHLLRRLRA